MVLGQEHIPQTKFLGLNFEILNDLRVGAEPGDDVAAIGVDLLGVDSVGGDAFFFDELLHLLIVSIV